jgi:hypothetical protein
MKGVLLKLPDLHYVTRARNLARAAVSKTDAAIIDGLPITADPVRFAVQTLGEAIESLGAYLELAAAERASDST